VPSVTWPFTGRASGSRGRIIDFASEANRAVPPNARFENPPLQRGAELQRASDVQSKNRLSYVVAVLGYIHQVCLEILTYQIVQLSALIDLDVFFNLAFQVFRILELSPVLIPTRLTCNVKNESLKLLEMPIANREINAEPVPGLAVMVL
jgi:hypothetical protein